MHKRHLKYSCGEALFKAKFVVRLYVRNYSTFESYYKTKVDHAVFLSKIPYIDILL